MNKLIILCLCLSFNTNTNTKTNTQKKIIKKLYFKFTSSTNIIITSKELKKY